MASAHTRSLVIHDLGRVEYEDGLALQVDTVLAGVHTAEVGEQHLAHFRILGRAGLGRMPVSDKVAIHFIFLSQLVKWIFQY